MLSYTFCHLSGIGEKAERKLWEKGVHRWEDLFSGPLPSLTAERVDSLRTGLAPSQEALKIRDHRYFSANLPVREHWRLFAEFKGAAAYVDIETTGLGRDINEITTIALYDGRRIRYYINGYNLDQFPDDIEAYDLLITYNGKCFDIPFMEDYFRTDFPQAHIDLRYVLHSLGYSGGLKGCERSFGLDRQDLEGVDGYFAVLLWQIYQLENRKSALETLLAYNIEDVVNLEYLMHHAYNRKVKDLPFAADLLLEVPVRPEVPFTADRRLIEELRYGGRIL
jgi:hypothetical protein